jgi:hypothetical protein
MTLKIEIRDTSDTHAEVWLVSDTASQCITSIEKVEGGWKNLMNDKIYAEESSLLETIYEELLESIREAHREN